MSNSQTRPTIIGLSLPGIKLGAWDVFFSALQGFESLERLNLKNSNFDYIKDLNSLGSYLAKNPKLQEIDLSNNTEIDNRTFSSGNAANRLAKYLAKNTNLLIFKYGFEFDLGSKSPGFAKFSLSAGIRKILKSNAKANDLKIIRKQEINKAIYSGVTNSSLLAIDSLPSILRHLEGVTKSLLLYDKRTDLRPRIEEALTSFEEHLTLAQESDIFKNSKQECEAINLGKYYRSQCDLLDALHQMDNLSASHDDRTILDTLRTNFLTQWKNNTREDDVITKNASMKQLIKEMQENCEQAKGQVKDETSGAIIKNILLILSAILTLGLSLGIYAAFKGEKSGFFYQNSKPSEESINNVLKKVKDVEKYNETISI